MQTLQVQLKSLLFVSSDFAKQLFLNDIGRDRLADRHIQLQCFRVNVANIHTALVVEENCVGFAMRVNADVSLFGLR